jgi:hypothetical protein
LLKDAKQVKETSSRVLRIVEVCSDPARRLQQLTTYPHEARQSHWVRLFDDLNAVDGLLKGNLEERLALHERDDVPYPEEDYQRVLLAEYRRQIAQGHKIYQFVLEDYTYYDDFEDEMDPSRPDYEEFETAPFGWLTIEQVCQVKDIDKSTVTRAIYSRELTCGLATPERRRYVKPDALFYDWDPQRKRSYLRDRRLLILYEILLNESVSLSLNKLYDRIEAVEVERFGGLHFPDEGLDVFFGDTISNCPASVISWRARIDAICRGFELNNPRKLHRALGTRKAA